MNQLLENNPKEVKTILAKYPKDQKRSALMPLLLLSLKDGSSVTMESVKDIAAILDITETEVVSVMSFYTLFPGGEKGKIRLQVCTDLSCALRGAEDYYKELAKQLEFNADGSTKDGLFIIEEVPCLAACHRVPMLQVQSSGEIRYHENMTVEKTLTLMADLRKGVK